MKTTIKTPEITNARLAHILVHQVKHNPETGCWDWTGAKSKAGYGYVRIGATIYRAHRVLFFAITDVQEDFGLVLDHLCENKGCVNPAHIEQVTQSVNIKRAFAKNKAAKSNKKENKK